MHYVVFLQKTMPLEIPLLWQSTVHSINTFFICDNLVSFYYVISALLESGSPISNIDIKMNQDISIGVLIQIFMLVLTFCAKNFFQKWFVSGGQEIY